MVLGGDGPFGFCIIILKNPVFVLLSLQAAAACYSLQLQHTAAENRLLSAAFYHFPLANRTRVLQRVEAEV